MTDTKPSPHGHDAVDPERTAPKNAFDTSDGYSGQEYSPDRAREQRERDNPTGPVVDGDNADIPEQAGHRASIDPRTGEVRGSGSGAGGGNPGEDYDGRAGGGDDPAAASGSGR